MDKETNDIIAKQMAILPKDVKDAIASVNYQNALRDITKRNGLLIDQAGKLETETTLVLLGLELLKDFVDNLTTNLGISRDKAILIAHDADVLIFKNIRDSLRKINDEDFGKENFIQQTQAKKDSSLPSREDILSEIENPTTKSSKSESSLNSFKPNSSNPGFSTEKITSDIELDRGTTLEIMPDSIVPAKIAGMEAKTLPPLHTSVSPINNIVEEKLSKPVDLPKEKVVVEENSKLPPKLGEKIDPYREAVE